MSMSDPTIASLPECAPQEPHFDERLPVREDRPDLNFNQKRRPVITDEDWQEVSPTERGRR